MGYLSIWTALIASEGFVGVLFNSGPFSWNGIFVFYLPLLVFSIWMVAMATTMLRAIILQAKVSSFPECEGEDNV